MPRTDDRSEGDARKPYADQGGPEGRHAQTHDVRREQATRSTPRDDTDAFSDDLAAQQSTGGHVEESISAADDKELRAELVDLDADDLKRLSVLTVGTKLDQGSTYVDLNDPDRAPFTALGGHETGEANRYVAKRDTDYELWDRLVGQNRPSEVERP